ncbi:hypothetical protein G7011_23985 [Pseudomonas plecoglossicida]|uniref:hypothetical protein n=1 Tax=Pseudomonas plecoglossicida TaxID=70775 RepID=UPI0015E3053C|nr:hypothetical protein [Pseudomonas plecoglossicida]MBA1200163.1 hypothetical protein [Pseudomonas plecoglossicida]
MINALENLVVGLGVFAYAMPFVFIGIGMVMWIHIMMSDDIEVMLEIVSANPRLRILIAGDVRTLRDKWWFVTNFSSLTDCHHLYIRRGKIVPEDLHAIPRSLRLRLRIGGGCYCLGIAWAALLYAARAIYEW